MEYYDLMGTLRGASGNKLGCHVSRIVFSFICSFAEEYFYPSGYILGWRATYNYLLAVAIHSSIEHWVCNCKRLMVENVLSLVSLLAVDGFYLLSLKIKGWTIYNDL